MTIHNVVIIGSGPAGYTAAIYTARAMLQPIMVTGSIAGGQLVQTTDVENYPGFPDGVTGPDLMGNMYTQARKFGTQIFVTSVKNIDTNKRPFHIILENDIELYSKSVIISTGAEALWLNLKGEEKLQGRGISTCAICDGALFKQEDIVVIGGGDSAITEAIFLTKYANKVTIIHRREEFRASKIMLERARKNKKIEWITSATIDTWLEKDGNLSGAALKTPNGLQVINCTGAFIAIGHRPATSFLNGQVETDSNGYILLKEHTMTSVPGIFACGDVVDTRYKQAITAAGQGCQAALDVERWLEDNDENEE